MTGEIYKEKEKPFFNRFYKYMTGEIYKEKDKHLCKMMSVYFICFSDNINSYLRKVWIGKKSVG